MRPRFTRSVPRGSVPSSIPRRFRSTSPGEQAKPRCLPWFPPPGLPRARVESRSSKPAATNSFSAPCANLALSHGARPNAPQRSRQTADGNPPTLKPSRPSPMRTRSAEPSSETSEVAVQCPGSARSVHAPPSPGLSCAPESRAPRVSPPDSGRCSSAAGTVGPGTGSLAASVRGPTLWRDVAPCSSRCRARARSGLCGPLAAWPLSAEAFRGPSPSRPSHAAYPRYLSRSPGAT